MGKRIVVLGAGGFIGSHLVKRLKADGHWVLGADMKLPEFSPSPADDFLLGDLRDAAFCKQVFNSPVDEVYQLAADMGGAGYLFTGENDADVMYNSSIINLNVLRQMVERKLPKVFYSSSACIYPEHNQTDPSQPNCAESAAYPAQPDSEYGWEKLFGERLYLSFMRNYGLEVRIARFHNIFGPEGTYRGGKEKAPAAICRKVAEAAPNTAIEIWGDGEQTRSFLYVDECIEGVLRLMNSNFSQPVNIGSDELISINNLAKMVIALSGKSLTLKHIPGPVGVRGRNSDNQLIQSVLQWSPAQPLSTGMQQTYHWVNKMVQAAGN